MGDNLRHTRRGKADDDSGEPTETGARPRRSDASEVRTSTEERTSARSISTIELRRGDSTRDSTRTTQPSGEQQLSARSGRPSIRPSAFGIPRVAPIARTSEGGFRTSSTPPAPLRAPDKKRESVPPGIPGRPTTARASTDAGPPSLAHASARKDLRAQTSGTDWSDKKRASSGLLPPPIVKTDIEELLPISHGVKSLPRPPRLPGFDPQQLPLASARYFPWASLGVFIVMLVGSFAPLSRYRGERQESTAIAAELYAQRALSDANEPSVVGANAQLGPLGSRAEAGAATPLAPALSAAGQVERALWGEPRSLHEALLEEGERALYSDDAQLAESLFATALEFGADSQAELDAEPAERDGKDARAEFGLARASAAGDDVASAEEWLLKAIHKRPRRVEYRALHADLLQRGGRSAEAGMERAAARALAHFSGETRPR